jgi:hypothetical protein
MTKILIFKDSVLETQKTEELRQSLIESIPKLRPGSKQIFISINLLF